MNLVRLRPTAKQFSLNFSDLDERTYKVASIRFLVTVWELDIIDSCTDLGIIFWWLSKEPLFKVYTCSHIFAVHIVSDIDLCDIDYVWRFTQNWDPKIGVFFKILQWISWYNLVEFGDGHFHEQTLLAPRITLTSNYGNSIFKDKWVCKLQIATDNKTDKCSISKKLE